MLTYGLTQTVAPTAEPITASDVKDAMRVTLTDEDSLIADWVVAARMAFEFASETQVMSATWKVKLRKWHHWFPVPRPPLVSVTSITYYDDNDTQQTVSSSDYLVDTDKYPGEILFKQSFTKPKLSVDRLSPIEVVYTSGYSSSDNVPQDIKTAIALLAGTYFKYRESGTLNTINELPEGFLAIAARYRPWLQTPMIV